MSDELTAHWYNHQIAIVNKRNAELEAQNAKLTEALEPLVWKDRLQFPDDPYCVICGAGRKWAAQHGHEPKCLLALQRKA